jgi:hypothetical protein
MTRFLHKLFNALKISEVRPSLYPFVGVQWVTDTILKVDKARFARLLGTKCIDGALFHQQGNFPSHGFAELRIEEARAAIPRELLSDV